MTVNPSPVRSSGVERWDELDVTMIIETRERAFDFAARWRPAVNAYRCGDRFVVYVDLAGVDPGGIEISAQPQRIALRGTRAAPEPGGEGANLCQLLALEIDHGAFERVLDLPLAIQPERVTSTYRDGLLRIELPLAG